MRGAWDAAITSGTPCFKNIYLNSTQVNVIKGVTRMTKRSIGMCLDALYKWYGCSWLARGCTTGWQDCYDLVVASMTYCWIF